MSTKLPKGLMSVFSALLALSVAGETAASQDTPPIVSNTQNTEPSHKPTLDAQLLRWSNTQPQTPRLQGEDMVIFWDQETRKRHSLYGANIYAVDLDVSVALKPNRLMSLDAAW